MGLRLVKGSTSRGTPANEKPATLPVRNCDHDSDDDQLLDFQDQNLPDLCQQDVEAKNGFDQPQNNLSSRSQSNHGNDGLHASTLGGEHATNRDEENEDGQRSDCSQVVTVPDADEPHALHAHSSQSDRLLRRKYAFRRLGLFLLLFTYEALAEQGLQLLNCVDMGNCGTVLAEHPDVVCTDSTYSHLRALAIGILIFTIAYPLLQLIFLVSSLKRGTLYTSQHLTKFGSMYGHFKEKFFWWGVVELVRRALAVFLYVQFFLQRDLRNYSLGIFNFVICSLQLAFQPFHHKSDNLLESISLALLVFASMTQASEAAVHWTMLTTVMKIFLTVGLVLFGTIVVFDLAREHACNVVNYGRGLCAWYKTVFRGWHGAYPNAVDQLQHRSSE